MRVWYLREDVEELGNSADSMKKKLYSKYLLNRRISRIY